MEEEGINWFPIILAALVVLASVATYFEHKDLAEIKQNQHTINANIEVLADNQAVLQDEILTACLNINSS